MYSLKSYDKIKIITLYYTYKKMKKLILFFITLFSFINICHWFTWEVLYVKNIHTPVLNTYNESIAQINDHLQKGYIVINKWDFWIYTKVKLTNYKFWYILKTNLWDQNILNPYKVLWNYWEITWKSFLYNKPFLTWDKIWKLEIWDTFFIEHINYINNYFIRVKIITWNSSWKVWYIIKNYWKFSYKKWYKNDIEKFIENNTSDEFELNSANNEEETELNSAIENPQPLEETISETKTEDAEAIDTTNENNTEKTESTEDSNSTDTSSTINNDEMNDFLNSLSDILK